MKVVCMHVMALCTWCKLRQALLPRGTNMPHGQYQLSQARVPYGHNTHANDPHFLSNSHTFKYSINVSRG